MPRSNRELWPLRKLDLPPRWAVAREPRFESLEHNPVFRMLTFQKRSRHRGWRGAINLVWPFAFTALMLYFLRVPGGSFSAWIIWGAILTSVLSRRNRKEDGILGIPRACIGDLHQAGVRPEVIAEGLWGVTASLRQILDACLAIAIGFVVAALFLFESRVAWLVATVFSLILGYWAANFAYWPASAASLVVRNAQRTRRALEARANPLRELAKRLLDFFRLLLIVGLIFLAVAFNIGLILMAVEALDLPLPSLVTISIAKPLSLAVFSAVMGAAIGRFAGVSATRKLEKNLAEAATEIKTVLELLSREPDAQSASPRASKSMSL